ncbi:hypothetical protein GCM10007916_33150 [Psychromonas marina]|uniref:Cadmium carbonic anhydrase n=1 Tax=Psychromonas marina TaxID=88364 RepID=A0ABQ6E4K0_9GAMM|nr:delta-class carbonic anhydrase [Psychromonas marina]GLS92245.1 hypothetical protein GCM10007916_33150 [Psychromonas marina]
MINKTFFLCVAAALLPTIANATPSDAQQHEQVSDKVIADQRFKLSLQSTSKGFGPQAPRDIDTIKGNNKRISSPAPPYTSMNLCNIHFHKNAEHKGGEFTKYAGNGDGHGYNTGFVYSGTLTKAELAPLKHAIGVSKHAGLNSGDTIEVHYVYSTALVQPGPTLIACLDDAITNPQLRVETQVYVLVNDRNALDFSTLTEFAMRAGYHQALHIPNNTGVAVQYAGSTTGPSYNEKASPFQVTWNVRPKVAKVNIKSVGKWLESNAFNENHAHAVRNLVVNPSLLSSR